MFVFPIRFVFSTAVPLTSITFSQHIDQDVESTLCAAHMETIPRHYRPRMESTLPHRRYVKGRNLAVPAFSVSIHFSPLLEHFRYFSSPPAHQTPYEIPVGSDNTGNRQIQTDLFDKNAPVWPPHMQRCGSGRIHTGK